MSELLLHDWGPSPFCLKVRSLLDYKGVPFRRRRLDPGGLARMIRRGGTGKVPAIELDGRLITDSTDIALAIEERWPDPPVVPTDPRMRAQCMALEDWADESLYWLGIHCQWVDPEGLKKVHLAFGRSAPARLVAAVYRRRVERQLHGQGTGRKSTEHVRRDLERALDTVEGLLEPGPWLLAEGPLLCDFAVGAQMVYLSRTPRGGPLVEARPSIVAHMGALRALRAGAQGA